MSLGELTAWQAGVDWGRAGLTATALATASKATLVGVLDLSAGVALSELGSDVFRYWAHRGLVDYLTAHQH